MTTELLSRCVALQEEITRLKDTVVTLNANLKNPYGKNGQKSEDVLQEGFHFKAPWQKVTKMDNRIVKLEVSTEAFSSDLQTVSVNLAVNYHVDTAKSFSIVKNVGTNYEDVLITPSVNEVMKSIMARYTAEQSITNRNIISTALLYELNDKLSNSGIYVSDINIIDFDFSDVYVAAIESKQVAEQEKLRAKIEQEQLTMEKESESARRVIDAEAAAEVAKIEAEAAAYAGEKEAAANEKIAESLTQPLIEYYKIQQWDGKLPNLMITAGVVSAMAGSEYSTPMLKMRSNRRSMGQQVRCHICGKARVTLCKDDSNPGKYICKACKDSLMQAIPKAVLKEACNKIKEEGLYNEL